MLALGTRGALGRARPPISLWRLFATCPRDPRDAVVKIFSTRQRPGWTVPWQDQPVDSSSGSGAVVHACVGQGAPARKVVLTAAHVVADTRYLRVQRSTDRFSGEKFRARVAAVCHEVDLALLVVDEESQAFADVVPLKVASANELPVVFDKVRVVGYPVGGDACSVTEGVVSRVEVQEYSHSLRAGLALTVDAAINSGNSGGPLVDAATARIVGVAFQKLVVRGVELQGHAVPAPLLQRFLEEVADLEQVRDSTGQPLAPQRLRMPSLGCDCQSLEPPALRRSLRMGDRSGVLISRLHYAGMPDGAPDTALQEGDVLLRFDGRAIDEHGFCELLGRRLHFAASRDLHRVGARVPMTVWRAGGELCLEHVLQPAQHLVPRGQFDVRPRFFICGGLVFQPLSHEYLQGWSANERPAHLQDLFLRGHLAPERTEVVMLSQILADTANAGYDSGWIGAPIVSAVNGEAVRSLEHLVAVTRAARRAASSAEESFLVFDVATSSGPFRIVLPTGELDAADARICDIYGVPAACCSDHYLDVGAK